MLQKLRAGEALPAKDKTVYEQGLAGVLRALHDALDAAVLAAYGWNDAPDDTELLARLVALNAQRAAEEARGTVRWLRPALQSPAAPPAAAPDLPAAAPVAAAAPAAPLAWPDTLPEQLGALARLLAESPAPHTPATLAARFMKTRGLEKTLPGLLDALAAVGRAQRLDDALPGRLSRAFDARRTRIPVADRHAASGGRSALHDRSAAAPARIFHKRQRLPIVMVFPVVSSTRSTRIMVAAEVAVGAMPPRVILSASSTTPSLNCTLPESALSL